MNAWLLTWEGTVGSAVQPEEKIVAILSSRRSARSIGDLVQTLYHRSVDTAYEMSRSANKIKAREQRYKHVYSTNARYFYGANPCIFARNVVDLSVLKDETNGVEIIQWTEPAIFVNATNGSGIEQNEPPRQCKHTRPLIPLAANRNARWVIHYENTL